MGYYIETDSNSNKANWLIENVQGIEIEPVSFEDIPSDKILVCVVDNGSFEAAGICCCSLDFSRFTIAHDPRPKRWVLIPRTEAIRLCPKVEPMLAPVQEDE